jgi:CDK inhibitor PHO81
LVLVTDVSDNAAHEQAQANLGVARPIRDFMPNGVDGILKGNGVLRFNESIDM